MSKFSLVLLLCVAVSGCATTVTPVATNEQFVRDLYAAFARGDGGAVIGAFDPQIRWMEAESSEYSDRNPYIGPQAVAEGVFGRLMSEWDGFQVHPEEFISEGNRVAVLGRYAAKYKATGRPLDAQFVHVWTVENGKATTFQQYADTAQFARVMGMQP